MGLIYAHAQEPHLCVTACCNSTSSSLSGFTLEAAPKHQTSQHISSVQVLTWQASTAVHSVLLLCMSMLLVCRGLVEYAAPLCYLYAEQSSCMAMFCSMYARFWCRLHAINDTGGREATLIPLSALFLHLLQVCLLLLVLVYCSWSAAAMAVCTTMHMARWHLLYPLHRCLLIHHDFLLML